MREGQSGGRSTPGHYRVDSAVRRVRPRPWRVRPGPRCRPAWARAGLQTPGAAVTPAGTVGARARGGRACSLPRGPSDLRSSGRSAYPTRRTRTPTGQRAGEREGLSGLGAAWAGGCRGRGLSGAGGCRGRGLSRAWGPKEVGRGVGHPCFESGHCPACLGCSGSRSRGCTPRASPAH